MVNSELRLACTLLCRSLTQLLCATLAFSFCGIAAASVQQPSSIMPKASKALLLDITKAGQRLVAVGDHGHILYSDDQGDSWLQAKVPTQQLLTAVSFVNTKQGWAVGHDSLILYSSDGGENWIIQRDGLELQKATNLSLTASVRDRLKLLKEELAALSATEEGARAELEAQIEEATYDLEDAETVLADPINTPPLMDVLFTSVSEGWVVGAFGQFYHTDDGGKTWESYASRIDNPDELHLNALAASRSGEVFVAGEAGLVFASTDGGASWQTGDLPYDGSLFGILSSEDGTYQFCFGLRGNSFLSRDKGASWQQVEVGTDFSLAGGYLAPSGLITAVGSGGSVIYTDNVDSPFSAFNQSNRLAMSSIVQITEKQFIAVGVGGIHHLQLKKTD